MQTNERRFSARPELMDGETRSIKTPIGTAYVTINFYEGDPIEILMSLGKQGTTERAMVEAIGRLCSTALQHGTPMIALSKQLRGISSEAAMGLGANKVLSVPDALGKVLEGYTNGYDHNSTLEMGSS